MRQGRDRTETGQTGGREEDEGGHHVGVRARRGGVVLQEFGAVLV